MDGASGLRAQSCSTEMARLCRITTVSFGGGGESRVSTKRRASPPPPLLFNGWLSYPNKKEIDKLKVRLCCPQSNADTAQSGRTIEAEMKLFPWARMMRERFKPAIQFAA